MNKESSLEALFFINQAFAHDPVFLEATKSKAALQALLLFISEEAAHGKLPLSPGCWGLFLAHRSVADA
jgi:hypothetical protein